MSSVTFMGPPAARYGGQWAFSPTPRPELYHSITSCSKLGPEVGCRGKSPVPSKLASESTEQDPGPQGHLPAKVPSPGGPGSFQMGVYSHVGAPSLLSSYTRELQLTLVRCQPPGPRLSSWGEDTPRGTDVHGGPVCPWPTAGEALSAEATPCGAPIPKLDCHDCSVHWES